jgi:hypothetical protein
MHKEKGRIIETPLRPVQDFVIARCSLSSVSASSSAPLYWGCSGFGLPRTPRLEPEPHIPPLLSGS